MLVLALLEGYLGYSMVDDLLSGMGLAIGYCGRAVDPARRRATSRMLIWGGPFPGDPSFESRMYIAHVLLLPVADRRRCSALHLALVAARHHTQFRGRRARPSSASSASRRSPARRRARWGCCSPSPPCSSCSAGSCRSTRSGCGGRTTSRSATNGAQPDWYLGWLIGALRLMPGFDVTIGDYTLVPNPFWGGVLFPLVVFGVPLACGRGSSAA